MDNTIVRQMLDVIEREYASTVTLRTLSSAVGRQPAYVGRLFRQEVGSTARDYLTQVRLEHAAVLIRDGVKIEAVALSVGYRSKKNFYQQFRKRFGTTPVLFRTERTPGVTPPSPVMPASPAPAERVAAAEPAPAPGTVAAIVRASNRAWRMAIRAQQLMVEHFDRFRTALLLTDDAGRYVGANLAARSLTGYSANELQAVLPSALLVECPPGDVRCVWQLLIAQQSRPGHRLNATIRTRTGELIGVHLITVRNFLWGRREMSTLLASIAG